VRILGLLFLGSWLMASCGGDGGGGGSGGSGGLVGDEECVEAQTYINEDPCAGDTSLDNSEWQIPLTGCMDENDSKLCVNCIKFTRNSTEECVLTRNCASECAPMHN